MDNWATTISIGLQYGVPLTKLIEKYKGQKFEPSGIVGKNDEGIKFVSSISDYLGKWLEITFIDNEEEDSSNEKKINNNGNDNVIKKIKIEKSFKEELGEICPVCGNQMMKKGHCSQICKCGFEDFTGCGG